MSRQGSGCATATCANPAPAPGPIAHESLRALFISLTAALILGAVGVRMLSIVPPRADSAVSPASAVAAPERDVSRDLLAELGRSTLDAPRVVSLLEASGMTVDEEIGTLRLARRAATAGGNWEKARDLGAIIAQLEAGQRVP